MEHRQARAKALHKRFGNLEYVVYVDAADYAGRDAIAVAIVDRQGNSISLGSVRTSKPEVGEGAAIALAIAASAKMKCVVSDSKYAIINYAKGRISPEASAILWTGLHNI